MIGRPFVLLGLVLLAGPGPSAGPSGYHVVKKVELGGEGGWDYLTLDASARRLYVSRSTRVAVLDADSYAPVGEIPDTAGVHGVALAPDLGRGFTSNGRAATATIFDLKTLAVLGQVKTGTNPDAILYDSASHAVFTFNGTSHDATVIDGASGRVTATVPLAGKPEFAVSDGAGRIYVNIEDKGQIAVLDARKPGVAAQWPLAPCEEPTGLAIDTAHRRLFAGCSNRMMAVVDAENGKLLATLPIGEGVDGTAFDAQQGLAFASNGEGTLTVVREQTPDRFEVLENVPTQRGARTLALDPSSHRIFLATAQFGPPPAPSAEAPHPRPSLVPGSFVILVVGR